MAGTALVYALMSLRNTLSPMELNEQISKSDRYFHVRRSQSPYACAYSRDILTGRNAPRWRSALFSLLKLHVRSFRLRRACTTPSGGISAICFLS